MENKLSQISKNFYYFINNGTYNLKLDYYYDLARQLANQGFGSPVSIKRVTKDFSLKTYVDQGKRDGIRTVKLKAGTLLLQAKGPGVDDNSHISFEKGNDFYCTICQVNENQIPEQSVDMVTDFSDCVKDGLMYFSYDDGTCSVMACSLDNFPKVVSIPELSPKGDRVVAIESHGFSCKPIKCLRLPQTLEAIGNQAFFLCESLKEIKCSSSLQYIAEDAFDECLEESPIKGLADKYTKDLYRSLFFVGYYENPHRGHDEKGDYIITTSEDGTKRKFYWKETSCI